MYDSLLILPNVIHDITLPNDFKSVVIISYSSFCFLSESVSEAANSTNSITVSDTTYILLLLLTILFWPSLSISDAVFTIIDFLSNIDTITWDLFFLFSLFKHSYFL